MKRIFLPAALGILFTLFAGGTLLAAESKAPLQQEWDKTLETASIWPGASARRRVM